VGDAVGAGSNVGVGLAVGVGSGVGVSVDVISIEGVGVSVLSDGKGSLRHAERDTTKIKVRTATSIFFITITPCS
jgi:hypothetical protein